LSGGVVELPYSSVPVTGTRFISTDENVYTDVGTSSHYHTYNVSWLNGVIVTNISFDAVMVGSAPASTIYLNVTYVNATSTGVFSVINVPVTNRLYVWNATRTPIIGYQFRVFDANAENVTFGNLTVDGFTSFTPSVNFNITSPGAEFMPGEYSVPSNGTVFALLNATNTTLRLVRRGTTEVIGSNSTVTDTVLGRSFTFNGAGTFPLRAGTNVSLTLENPSIVPQTVAFTLDMMSNTTIVWNGSIRINVTLWDEGTFGPFDVSSPDRLILYVFCTDKVAQSNVTSNTLIVPIDCDFTKIRFQLDYGTKGSYYRTYLWAFNDTDKNKKAWLVNLNSNDTVVASVMQLYDVIQEYTNPQIRLYRYINGTEEQILGDYADIEGKITAYLMQNQEYVLKIVSDNKGTRIMGNYFADSARSIVIRLNNIDLTQNLFPFGSNVNSYSYLVNNSGVVQVIMGHDDTLSGGDNFGSVEYTIRLDNETGPIVFTTTSSDTIAQVAYTVPVAYENSTFVTKANFTKTDGSHVVVGNALRSLKNLLNIRQNMKFTAADTLNWIVYLFVLGAGFAFSIGTGYIGSFLVGAFLAFATFTHWLQFPAGANSGWFTAIFIVIALIQFFFAQVKGRRSDTA
jgi:hypothetical protein